MRRLAAAGITTREACGNSVRNVTACPLAGVCRTEAFDVTPYAKAIAYFLLGHPDTQDFGRKFKIAFSGCEQEACGLVNMHDMGALALVQNGKRGFKLYVGGGLGPVPYQAKVFAEFVPEEELLPIGQAIARVFARLGEKQNRARARIKFLIAKLGVDEFKRLVMEERKVLQPDQRWTAFIPDAHGFKETALKSAASLNGSAKPKASRHGRRRTSTSSFSRAMRWRRFRCRLGILRRSRPAELLIWRGSSVATIFGRQWNRISCSAGWRRRICRSCIAS